MIFQGWGIDFQTENRSKIYEKMPSKMECLNLRPFCYENQAQDAPKTPQDARGGPKRRLKAPQDTPGRPKTRPGRLPRRPKTCPRRPKTRPGSPKTRPRRPDRLQEPPRPPPDLDFGPFWQRFWTIFGRFLKDFGEVFSSILYFKTALRRPKYN